MFKLIFLTLLALVTVLVVFGEGDGRRIEAPSVEAVTPAAGSATAPNPALPTEAVAASAGVVDAPAVQQTPQQVQDFPGPDLRPSPEFAGQTPAANPASDLAAAPTDTLYVTGNSVNFRAGPTTGDAIVGKLTRGHMVTAIGERSGDWVEIRDSDGRTGFIASQFLSSSRP